MWLGIKFRQGSELTRPALTNHPINMLALVSAAPAYVAPQLAARSMSAVRMEAQSAAGLESLAQSLNLGFELSPPPPQL